MTQRTRFRQWWTRRNIFISKLSQIWKKAFKWVLWKSKNFVFFSLFLDPGYFLNISFSKGKNQNFFVSLSKKSRFSGEGVRPGTSPKNPMYPPPLIPEIQEFLPEFLVWRPPLFRPKFAKKNFVKTHFFEKIDKKSIFG